jgi:hypothetical protein
MSPFVLIKNPLPKDRGLSFLSKVTIVITEEEYLLAIWDAVNCA